MKKKRGTKSVTLFFSLLVAFLFIGCDHDTNCYLEVTVYDGSSLTPISGTYLTLYQTAEDASDYNYREGVTEGNGVYKTTYTAPAIIYIHATHMMDTIRPDYYRGYSTTLTSARLIEGEIKKVEIHMPKDTLWEQLPLP